MWLSQPWTPALIRLGLAVTAIVPLYWSTVTSLVGTWVNSATYNHGLFILPVTLYWCWNRRDRLQSITPAFDRRGLVLLAVGSAAWMFGRMCQAKVLEEAAVVAMIPSLVLTLLGWQTVRILGFPLGLLVFAVPMGEELVPFLQDVTAIFAVKGLEWSGVPVHWEGRVLLIPSGVWEVVESCSGIRYLFAALVCGYVLADWAFARLAERLLFLLASALISIGANGMRAYGIIMLAHLTNNQIAVGVDHLLYGWVLFGCIVALLAVAAGVLGDKNRPGRESGPDGCHLAQPSDHCGFLRPQWAVGILLAISIGPAWEFFVDRFPVELTAPTIEPPSVALPWQVAAVAGSSWSPRFEGASAVMRAAYSDGRSPVQLYLASYAEEREGAELVSSNNRFVEPDGMGAWKVLREGRHWIMVEGQRVQARELLLYSGEEKRIVMTWYWMDDMHLSSSYHVKLLQGINRLLRRPSIGVAIVIDTVCPRRPEDGRQAIEEFLQHTSFGSAFSPLGHTMRAAS